VESSEKKQERKKKQTVAKQAPYGRDAPEALVKRQRIAGRARSPLNASFYRYRTRLRKIDSARTEPGPNLFVSASTPPQSSTVEPANKLVRTGDGWIVAVR
jgi:hypothetical protein